MNRRLLIEIGLGVIAFFVVALVYSSYRQSQDDKIRLEQVLTDQKKIIADSQETQKQNDQKWQAIIEDLKKQKAEVKTPEQAIKIIHDNVQGTTPIIYTPPPTTSNPTPTPVIQFPQEQAKLMSDFIFECKECKADLAKAQGNNAELVRQMQAIEEQRNAAIKAAKGGGFWTRVKRNGKWFVVGIGTGIAVTVVASQ